MSALLVGIENGKCHKSIDSGEADDILGVGTSGKMLGWY